MKKILLILFILVQYLSQAQSVTLTGKVVSSATKLPLESATVYLSKVQDSTLIDYTITDKFGKFSIKTATINQAVELKISSIGYADYSKALEKITTTTDFGTLEIDDLPQGIDEIVIKTKAPPIRIKKDTLEFDAASFKLRPDANVETLLKQLPGVEIDEDGKITVNGKEVNEILVNGKPFFDKDGKIALQNLPAEIVNKIQVSDTKTKVEKKTGEAAKSNNASINITIDEDKNQGFFGKVMGGYGSDERYESSLLLNYFKGTQKISLLASSNNINSTGFSMDEIFDNMGGGRSRSMYFSDNGSFSVNGRSFGGGKGITQSSMVGVNFSDNYIDAIDLSSSYFYSNGNTENANKTRQVNLLPDGDFVSNSESTSRSENSMNNVKADFEYEISDKLSVGINPNFSNRKSISKSNSSSTSTEMNGELLNDSESINFSESTSNDFQNELYLTKGFEKEGRFLTVSFGHQNTRNKGYATQKSIANFYKDIDDDGISEITESDIRNQKTNSDAKDDRYSFDITFTERFRDSTKVNFSVNYEKKSSKNYRETLDFNEVTGQFSDKNDRLSDDLSDVNNTVTPTIGFNSNTNNYFYSVNFGTSITRLEYLSNYMGVFTNLQRQYLYPSISLNGNYRFSKTMSLYGNYNYDYSFASSRQILPVENLSNPLNTVIGNADILPSIYHNIYISFRNYDYTRKSGYNFYLGGNIYDRSIVGITTFDESKKRTTTYTNVTGVNSFYAGISYNQSFKKEAHSYRFNLGLSGGLDNSIGYTDGEMYKSLSYRLTPNASFTYEYGELLTINPSYRLSFNNTEYTNYLIDQRSNVSHRFNIQVTNYWPKNLVFGNDFGYTYNSNISDGFKKDFYLWNTSLGYNFLEKTLLAKVKVYDVLNQNISTTNSISATAITDEENTVLKRYVMFSLTYKLEQFAAKKQLEKKNNRRSRR